jgi:hypothetical protein
MIKWKSPKKRFKLLYFSIFITCKGWHSGRVKNVMTKISGSSPDTEISPCPHRSYNDRGSIATTVYRNGEYVQKKDILENL